MKAHIKIYFKYFDIDFYPNGWHDFSPCEVCGSGVQNVHHIIFKSQGGGDNIENLIGLCYECHTKAHNGKINGDVLQEIHNNKLGL